MKLREIMRTRPVTVTEDTPLGDVRTLMRSHHLRHVPVVAGGKLRGMISERDLYYYRAVIQTDEEWARAPARWAMTAPVQTAGPDDSLTDVAGRLAAAHLGAMPIVERGMLVGLVTATDVLDAEAREALATAQGVSP